MRCSAIVLTAIFVTGWLVVNVEARGYRIAMLPQTPCYKDEQSSRERASICAGCGTCHIHWSGGGPRNSFGLAVEALVTPDGREVFWGPELAALDSDGDGFTNGEELGDPQGIWEEGNESPGNADEITHPGDPASHPPEDDTPTAVAESSWGKLKRLVEKVLK